MDQDHPLPYVTNPVERSQIGGRKILFEKQFDTKKHLNWMFDDHFMLIVCNEIDILICFYLGSVHPVQPVRLAATPEERESPTRV